MELPKVSFNRLLEPRRKHQIPESNAWWGDLQQVVEESSREGNYPCMQTAAAY